ncbi:MAG: cofactor-independent phosphoglycerate mutase [Proteobacteria bacterium]|nr:cofactor-independent phosphoglycerate mutase [Pseudomonadota bacterium]
MKYAVLVGDGMGDHAIPELGGRTVLEAARTPHMDALAREGLLGLARTIPDRNEPGSDVANMAIMGYDPAVYHTGRGPLEAASMGISLEPDELAFRLNLVTLGFDGDRVVMRDHSAGHITSDEARVLIRHLAGALPLSGRQRLHPGVSYRHLLVWPGLPDGLPTIPPHDYRDREVTDYLDGRRPGLAPVIDLVRASWPILRDHPVNQARRAAGRSEANSIWPWGQGRPPAMPTYRERWGLSGAVVSAVDLIKGLGVYAGLEPLDVPGATGLLDTDYEAKVSAALGALETGDYVLVHVEAPDEAGHQGDWESKLLAVERFDERIVGPMRAGMEKFGDFRLLILCDHFTPVSVKTHTREAVPFILYPSVHPSGRSYTEAEAEQAGLFLDQGHTLVDLLLGGQA